MKILRTILILLIIAGIAFFAYWYINHRPATPTSTALTSSGTVETTEVIVSPEVTGRITSVLVSEGDTVKSGATLFTLDDTLLNAQRDQAQANLAAAQAGLEAANTALLATQAAVTTAESQYHLALANARLQAQPAQNTAWSQSQPSEINQPVWYFTHAEEITATLKEVSAAADALVSAQTKLTSLQTTGVYTDLVSIESRLAQAQSAFLNATGVHDRANAQSDTTLRDAAQQAYDAAKAELDAAQKAYDELLTGQEAQNVLDARARLAAAQARYDDAINRYNGLLTGEYSLAVRLAADAVAQAQANVSASQSKVTQAQKAIDQAQSALNLVDAQLTRLTITTPVNGIVLARNVEPGEVALAGATTFTLGQLDKLTITVYIPENRYGEVKLGDTATVSIDSFPAQLFFCHRHPHRRPGRVHPPQCADRRGKGNHCLCSSALCE